MRGSYLALAGVWAALTWAPSATVWAQAQPITAQALIDRAEISDLLTRYYWNFGDNSPESFAKYYAEDAEFVLGDRTVKGIEAIKGVYAAVPADAPQRKSFALNILIGNPLITVRGNTATARLVFTETLIEKQGDAPKILTQGREFDHLVKRNGRWLISKRQIMGANGMPEGWQD